MAEVLSVTLLLLSVVIFYSCVPFLVWLKTQKWLPVIVTLLPSILFISVTISFFIEPKEQEEAGYVIFGFLFLVPIFNLVLQIVLLGLLKLFQIAIRKFKRIS